MSRYALNPKQQRVQSAMQTLGISEQQLLVYSFQQFQEPGLSEEIQSIRFNHHRQQLGKTVNQIKTFINPLPQDRNRIFSPQARKKPLLLTEIKHSSETKPRRIRQWQTIVDSPQSRQQDYFNHRIKRMKAGLTVYQNQRRGTTAPYLSTSLPPQKEENSLQKIKLKLQSSKKKYKQGLFRIKEDMKKKFEKANNILRQNLTSRVTQPQKSLQALMAKQKAFQQRKSNIQKLNQQKRQNQKEKMVEKQTQAAQRIKKQQLQFERRQKIIQNRINATPVVIQKRKQTFVKEMYKKQEINRLLNEDVVVNSKRQDRVQAKKRELLMQKHAADHQRIQALKTQREKTVDWKRELALKSMIEKEKIYYSILSHINSI